MEEKKKQKKMGKIIAFLSFDGDLAFPSFFFLAHFHSFVDR